MIKKNWVIVLSLITIVGIGIVIFYQVNSLQKVIEPKTKTIPVEEVVEVEYKNIQEKIDGLKQDILTRLAQCEIGGVKEPNSAMILDSNNKMSIGRYMWQRESVVCYAKRLYGIDITRTEAILIAIDQHPTIDLDEFTLDVMFKIKNGADAWFNCTNKHGFRSEIKIIKKLQ